MVTGSDTGENHAACGARRDRFRGENIVEAPADIALAHVAPWRPPREQVWIFRIERAAHVDKMRAEQRLEKLALIGALSDDAGFALARMHVDVETRDVEITAHDDFASLLVQPFRPCREPG